MQTSSYKNSAKHFSAMVSVAVVLLCFLALCTQFGPIFTSIWKISTVVILVVTGFLIIYKYSKSEESLVNPINIFSLIWFILVPITSFEAPLMEPMSLLQWQYVLVALICFGIGGYLAAFVFDKKKPYVAKGVWHAKEQLYNTCLIVIILGILLYFVQAKISGGFPIFSSNPDEARRHFYVQGLALLSNFPIVAIFMIFCDPIHRKKKLFILLTAIFAILQILLAVRFLLFLLFIMLMAVYGENFRIKEQIKKILRIVILCLIGFLIVASVRGGVEDKQRVFVNTNIYEGTAEMLAQTEILRYFGMSQRVMEEYMLHYTPATSTLGHTLFPILNAVGMAPELPDHYGIYGYTACNIITYFYFDAGYFWWLLMIFWSFLMNYLFFRYKRNSNSVMNKYLWSVAAISLAMSFYCYVNTFPYWYCHYIFVLILLNQVNIKRE